MQYIIYAIIHILISVISYYNSFELTVYVHQLALFLGLQSCISPSFKPSIMYDKQEYPKVFNCISQ